MSNDLLDRDLRDLSRAVEFPLAPDIATRVRERLIRLPQAAGSRNFFFAFPRPVRFAALAFAVLIAIAAALAFNPTTRDALARFFGLKRVQIIYEDSAPATATALSTPIQESRAPTVTPERAVAIETRTVPVTATPSPTQVRATPERLAGPAETLTGATSLQDARSRAPFTVLAPTYPEDLGEPDAVYLQELARPDEVQVIIRYPDFTLFQFRATGIFTKLVGSGTNLQEVTVAGARGFWLDSAFHVIEYRTADGREVADFRRQVAGNTLAWEVGDLTYRLENTLTLEEALKVAESLR